jgi:hypothetical protein
LRGLDSDPERAPSTPTGEREYGDSGLGLQAKAVLNLNMFLLGLSGEEALLEISDLAITMDMDMDFSGVPVDGDSGPLPISTP